MESTNLKKSAAVNGLIWGGINIVLFLLIYYAAPSIMGATWYSFVNLAIGLLLAIFFTKDLRTKAGGYWTFSYALKHIFIMFIISALFVAIFTNLFGKVIDTSYPVKMKEMIMNSTAEMYENFGMTGEAADEAMAKMDEELDKQFNPTFSQAIVAFGIIGIFYFIGALIFAAIFKKNPPLFIDNEDEYVASTTTV